MRTVVDTDADAAVYEQYRDELIRFAAALVGPGDAPDVLSAVIVRILRSRRLADLDDPRPYLYRAVLNEARSVLRHRSVADRAHQSLAAAGGSANPGPGLHDGVLEAVADLPPKQRAATYLVYWMGCTSAQAADLMHTRPATVRRYLHLARGRLREVLDEPRH